ncbi:MAG: thiamine-phosphate kinase [Desulfocapsaceae bacterium]|nr:thiamine-phosphate kinase [Desulfocapsaceae bacterium]
MEERAVIDKIKHRYLHQAEGLLKGIGDDCAVISDSGSLCWLLSSDLLVEDTHFRCSWHDPFLLGRKSVAVNISDIAAMGGTPKFLLTSLVLPGHISEDWLDRWQDGVQSMLTEHSCLLVGGDVSGGKQLVVDIMVIGQMHPDKVVYRSGALHEEDIYVSGNLGSSAAGLALLQNEEYDWSEFSEFIAAHLNPQPQVEIGRFLAENELATSMQDLSDGIATDLSHICTASKITGIIESDCIPMDGKLPQVAAKLSLDPVELAVYGGEDYQLLFTAHPDNREKIQSVAQQTGVQLTKVGTTFAGPPQVFLESNGRRTDISFKGYQHIS